MSLVCVHVFLKVEGVWHMKQQFWEIFPPTLFLLLNFLRVLINKASKKSIQSIGTPMDFHQKGVQLPASFWSSVYWPQYLIWIWILYFFKISVTINSLPDNSIFKISYWINVSTIMSPSGGKVRGFCTYKYSPGLQPNVYLLSFRTPGTHKNWYIYTRHWLYIPMK